MNSSNTYFIITVDTEAYKVNNEVPRFEDHIYGAINGDEWGVRKIVDTCDHYNGKCTFFIDFCMHHQYGESPIRSLCEWIDARGHDVQVHAHPSWIPETGRPLLHLYPYEIQCQIIQELKLLYEKFLNRPPLAFRAGAYGANFDTVRALSKNGFQIDSSYFFNHKNCELSKHLDNRYYNRAFQIEKLIEMPITVYSLFKKPDKKSKIDINACSYTEMKYVFQKLIENPHVSYVILFLHSFSFITQGNKVGMIKPDLLSFKKFEKTLKFLKSNKNAEIICMNDFFNLVKGSYNSPVNGDDIVSSRPWMLIPRYLGRLIQRLSTNRLCNRLAWRTPGVCQTPGHMTDNN